MPDFDKKNSFFRFFDFRNLAMRTTLIVLLGHLALLIIVVFTVSGSLNQLIEFQDHELLERRLQFVLEKIQVAQDLAEINEVVSQQRAPSNLHKRVYTIIYDQAGEILFSSASQTAWDHVFPTKLPLPSGSMRPDGVYFLESITGRNFAYVKSDINENVLKGTLVIAADHDVEDVILNRLKKLIPASIVVLGLISFFFSWLLFRSAILPIRKLTKHIASIDSVAKNPAVINDEIYPPDFRGLVKHYNEMLQRLHSSYQRVSSFTSDIAHELRSPLNNLMGEIEVALAKKREVEDYEQILISSREEVERLRSIVSSLLKLSQTGVIESSQLEILNINSELRTIYEYFIAFADEAGVRFELDMQTEEGQLMLAQKILMQQAIGNLVSNAIKFTNNGGQVILRSKINSSQDQVIIAIEDSGSGISEADLPYIFNRFYKVDQSRAYHLGGTGLGLAIVKNIIDRHRGTVHVNSKVGQGTVFETFWQRAKSNEGAIKGINYD